MADEVLGAKVFQSFVASDRTYGARRVWHDVLELACTALNGSSTLRLLRPDFVSEDYLWIEGNVASSRTTC